MRHASESSHQAGCRGEERASDYLSALGWRVLERNFRTRHGEVDIIALDGEVLVFVEVKSWKAIGIGDLEISINKRKQRRIIDVSRVYMVRKGLVDSMSVRYDLIFVDGDSLTVQHVRDAFTEST